MGRPMNETSLMVCLATIRTRIVPNTFVGMTRLERGPCIHRQSSCAGVLDEERAGGLG
jgi:hypothetical protein